MSPSTTSTPTPATGPTRRNFCAGALAATGAASLAACGQGGSGSTAAEEIDGGWQIATGEIEVGSTQYFQGARIVVTQPSEGDFHAFDATCPHQGCMVSEVQDGSPLCPCHTSVFDPTDGSPVSGPAQGSLTELDVEVDGENLIVHSA